MSFYGESANRCNKRHPTRKKDIRVAATRQNRQKRSKPALIRHRAEAKNREMESPREPKGITIHANDIPKKSHKIWELLNRAYGAAAVYVTKSNSLSFFPNQDAGLSFSYMVEDTMDLPVITDRTEDERAIYEERVGYLRYRAQTMQASSE